MISRDATLAFTQAALALAAVPRDVGPRGVRASQYEINVVQAVHHLEHVLALARDGLTPEMGVVAKFIVELEAHM